MKQAAELKDPLKLKPVAGKKRGKKEWKCPCSRNTIKEKDHIDALKQAREDFRAKFHLFTFMQRLHRSSDVHQNAIKNRKHLIKNREKVRDDKGKSHAKTPNSRLGKRGLGKG